MADNVTADAGAGGATFKTDDDGTAHWPYTKMAWGADNTQTRVDSGAAAVPIQDGGNTITVDGTVTANLSATDNTVLDNIDADTSAIQTAVELIDDTVVAVDASGTSAKVVMVGALRDDALAALTPVENDAVSLRVGSTGALWTAVTGTVTVDGSGVTQPVSGTVTADLGATDNAVLDTIETNTDSLTVVGGGTEATALRVTIANNSTGVLSVDDNGGALTVDGTVTANLSATDNAVLDSIDTSTQGILADTANIETAVQLIDDSIVAVDAVGTSAKVIMLGAIRDDTLSALTPVEGDAVNLRVNSTGALHVTGGGGGTEYAVDDALGATPTGSLAIAIRDDALSTLTPVEGDAIGLRVDSTGALWVTATAGAAQVVLGTDTYTEATSEGVIIGAVRRDADTPLADTTNEFSPLITDANGYLKVEIFDGGGSHTVDGTVTANLSATDNTVLDNIDADTSAIQTAVELIDDAIVAVDAVGTSAKVIMIGALRDDSLAALTPAEDDAVPLRVNSTGALHVTGGGGGTQYNVDDVAGGTDTGTLLLAVRDDSLAALTPADGDYTSLRVSSTGALHVTGGGGGTEYTEDVATANPIVGTATMMERDDALSALTPIEGDWAAMRCDANGALWVAATDGGGTLTVDGTVTANLSATDNTVLDNIDADTSAIQTAVEIIDNAIFVDDAAYTLGTSSGVMIMGFAGTQSVNANDACALACDTDGALQISDGGNSLTVDNGGTFAVQVDGSALTALQLIDNPVLVDDAAFTPATSSVMMAGFQADESSTDSVDEGDAGAARMTLDRKQIVTPQPHTAGGLTIFRSIDLDESEEEVKATAGSVYAMWVTNTATSTRFIKFYNATTANVTVGTTTPVITIGIPGNSSDDISGNFGPGGMGITFDTAITVAATTGVADNDTGAPGANEVIVNIFYK